MFQMMWCSSNYFRNWSALLFWLFNTKNGISQVFIKTIKQGNQRIRQDLSTFRSPICSQELLQEGSTQQTRIYFGKC